MEFWLVTAFHENGSLCDYLKSNTVSMDELSKISFGIAAGVHIFSVFNILSPIFISGMSEKSFRIESFYIQMDKTF